MKKILLALFLSMSLVASTSAQTRRPSSSGSSSSSSSKNTSSAPKSSGTVRPGVVKSDNSAKTDTDTPKSTGTVRPNAPKVTSSSDTSSASDVKKPTIKFDSDASDAKKRSDAKVSYERATAPKADFKTPDGKTYKINSNDTATQRVRNMSADDYNPQVRRQRVDVYYHHQYDNRPPVYIRHYRSELWYDSERWSPYDQAMFLMANQSYIDNTLYQQRLQNAAVAQQMAYIRAQNIAVDPNYVPAAYSSAPAYAVYNDSYIDAAYNAQTPTATYTNSGSHGLRIVFWTLAILVMLLVIFVLFFVVNWNSSNN